MMKKSDDYDRRPFLNILAALDRPLVGVEVGVQFGDNAARILNRCQVNHLSLVDTWQPYTQFGYPWDFSNSYNQVVERFANDARVTVIRESSCAASLQFSNESLDFVYIDACHEVRSVFEDIEMWLPKVKSEGILGGHDFSIDCMGVVWAVLKAQINHDWDLHTQTPDWWIVIERQNI